MNDSTLQHRNLAASSMTAPAYTERQQTVLRILALIFAILSIVSTSYTFYWFLTMRKSFRHYLVMILIQSDTFKALWFLIYAIAAFAPGKVESASTLCQIIGFFHTVGLEAADFAVLLIAVHSALYIFRPPMATGEGGIYPYRYKAYVLLVTLPLLMASLAFLNPVRAYYSGGATCGLPVRPIWYQLALNWGPRYMILLAILAIDTSIYIYIKYKIGGFRDSTCISEQILGTENSAQRSRRRKPSRGSSRKLSLPRQRSTPTSIYVVPMSARKCPLLVRWTASNSMSWENALKSELKTPSRSSLMKWVKSYSPHQFSQNAKDHHFPTAVPPTGGADGSTNTTFQDATTVAPKLEMQLYPIPGAQPISKPLVIYAAQFNSSIISNVPTPTILRASRPQVSFTSAGSEIDNSMNQILTQASPGQIHRKIRRQLRYLFIYPLLYLLMWILPFISNVLRYNDYYVEHPPFILTAFVTIIVVSQSTIDCFVFNIKEKPWRRSTKTKRFFKCLPCLKSLRLEWKMPSLRVAIGKGKGKGTMEEEARFAYQRRDLERVERGDQNQNGEMSERGERSWWDRIDDMAGMRDSSSESQELDLVDDAVPADGLVRNEQEARGEVMHNETGIVR